MSKKVLSFVQLCSVSLSSQASGQDAVVAGVVFEDSDIRESGMFGDDRAGGIGLIESDLQKNVRARHEMAGRLGEDSAMNGQAVDAAVEGGQRFVLAHAAIQLGNLRTGNVRRIGDQQLKRLAIGQAIQRGEKIAVLHRDAIGQTQAHQVFASDGDGFFADIGGHDDRLLDVVGDCGGDAAAAGAEVQDSRGFQAGLMADELNDVFNQRFGIRARIRTSRVTWNSRLKKWARPVRYATGSSSAARRTSSR